MMVTALTMRFEALFKPAYGLGSLFTCSWSSITTSMTNLSCLQITHPDCITSEHCGGDSSNFHRNQCCIYIMERKWWSLVSIWAFSLTVGVMLKNGAAGPVFRFEVWKTKPDTMRWTIIAFKYVRWVFRGCTRRFCHEICNGTVPFEAYELKILHFLVSISCKDTYDSLSE